MKEPQFLGYTGRRNKIMTDSTSQENRKESYEGFMLVKVLAEVTDKSCSLKQVWCFSQCLSDNRMAKQTFLHFSQPSRTIVFQERNYHHESTVKYTTI